MRDQVQGLFDSAEFAEEKLVASAQSLLQEIINEKGISRTDLARMMGVSKSRVSQLFSDDQNFTFRLIAKAFYALGEGLHLSRQSKLVEYKSADLPPGGHVPFEASAREISHGFEWMDRRIEHGGQSISKEPTLSMSEVACLMKEVMRESKNETAADTELQSLDSEQNVANTWTRAQQGSNVVPLLKRA